MRLLRGAFVGTVVAGLTWFMPAHAMASTVGDWQMDETAGSTLMVDSSGNGLNGTIGPDVVLHERRRTAAGATASRATGGW